MSMLRGYSCVKKKAGSALQMGESTNDAQHRIVIGM
jgi:hypothetical protein